MSLPNGERAFVDIQKLTEYCLDPEHERGKHKARVFEAVCGLTADYADVLRDALLEAARKGEAELIGSDRFGDRFAVEYTVIGPSGSASVRSAWIVRRDEDFPRLVSCFVR